MLAKTRKNRSKRQIISIVLAFKLKGTYNSLLQFKMERCLKQYDKECMKMAMLKQEETFRHQVHELHRLYRIQKLLMNDMKNAELKRQIMYGYRRTDRERLYTETETTMPQQCYSHQQINLEHQPDKYIGKNDSSVMLEIDEESELELTLAIGSRQRKKKEASFTSDSGASISSSSAESSGVKQNGHDWRLLQFPDVNTSFQSDRKSSFDGKEQMRQERVKHPPWLFQCLSLNIT